MVVSKLIAGSLSDKELTRSCGFLELLEPGDWVLADKGFDISYDLMLHGARLDMPPFLSKNCQMSTSEVTKNM
jgi:hypothetical protein